MQAYKEVHFLGPNGEEHKPDAQIEAGASGRKKSLDDIARFLRFAVDVCGMPKRYLPPDPKQIEELVGFKTVSTTNALTPAIKPEMFVELLDDLLEEARSVNMLPLRLLDIAASGQANLQPCTRLMVRPGLSAPSGTPNR